ncbi:hypothetical protein [Methylomonas albis]|uniref:DUF4145 domain-containing protein n=1 Tax=Methylomonas albis TaxID=1854563 RepID=A0ABR9D626_9GAMM|nr:DUF4145 domain-containing protein [Methylomonas albis]MBD9358390.1 hypothetical protein [Methylomonas albis]CAD6881787.1 hypothetical protein [Methylomonas albis]
MELLVTLITGIAWPVAVVWIAYLFKGELRSLMHRMSQLKYKDVEAKFELGLAEAEAKVTVIEQSSPSILPRPEITSKLELLRRIADVSLRAAIMEAWVLVEDAAGKSGFVQGAAVPRVNLRLFVEELVRLGKLPKGGDSLLDQMRRLRNQAAHLPDFSFNQDEADRYLQLATRMSELILNVE